MPVRRYRSRPRRARAPARRSRPAYRKRYAKKSMGAIKNYFRYKRFCPDSTLINQGPGDVIWESAAVNWQLGTINTDDNGLYQFGGCMRFQLDDIISKSDFTNLYDRYTINGCKITFQPLVNQGYTGISSSGNTSSATIPTMNYCIDYDDSTIPTTSLDILEKMDAKFRRLDKPVSIYIKNPKVSTIIQSDSGNISAGIGFKGYVNCANDNVNFRGLKFYIRDMALPDFGKNLNSLIRVQVKYYLTFKDPQ